MNTLPLTLLYLLARSGKSAFAAAVPAELRAVMAAFGLADIGAAATARKAGSVCRAWQRQVRKIRRFGWGGRGGAEISSPTFIPFCFGVRVERALEYRRGT
jgi:hypothetical protein